MAELSSTCNERHLEQEKYVCHVVQNSEGNTDPLFRPAKAQIDELETNTTTKNIRDLHRGINDFKKVYQPKNNTVQDEKSDLVTDCHSILARWRKHISQLFNVHGVNPYPTAFPYGNGMVLHFYQQQESSTTKTVHKVINKRLKTYV